MRPGKLIEILEKLHSYQLPFSEAYEQIKVMPKPWHTKDWKTKRDSIIKTYCEECLTTEGIMVLQHTKHPEPFYNIQNRLIEWEIFESMPDFPKYFEKLVNDEINFQINERYQLRQACPKCGIITIRERKTTIPKFECGKGHRFEEGVEKKYYLQARTTNEIKARLISQEYAISNCKLTLMKDYQASHREEIGRKSLIEAIQQSLEYLSFVHTKTCCKKCAFKEDFPYAYNFK